MTSAPGRRLKKIEEALDPTAVIALWLTEARQSFDTLRELVEDLRTKPDEALPLFRLTRQAEAMAKNRLKGQASVFAALNGQRALYMEQGSRGAVRDAAALWYLFVGVNERFRQDRRALTLLVSLLHFRYAAWVRSDLPEWEDQLNDDIASCLVELHAWEGAIGAASERYFAGISPLLPEAEAHLAALQERAELLTDRFNDSVELEEAARRRTKKRRPKLLAPIDTAKVRRNAQPSVDALLHSLVDMAQAEACDMMGEKKQALAFAERHL